MSRRPTARASAWRFAFSLEGLRGKEVRRVAITCSIFTLDPPGASAHSHRTSSDFASEGYKVHLCMQQQNASATNFFTPRNGALPSLVRPQGNDPKSPQPLLHDSKRQAVASAHSSRPNARTPNHCVLAVFPRLKLLLNKRGARLSPSRPCPYRGGCTFTFTSILALAVTCTTSPPAKYFSSTPGVNHSSSHPFSIATTVYLPGCTPGSANDPSESLWSRRKSTRLSSGTSGTSTIMTPSTGLPSFTAKPVTRPVPSDSTTLSLTSCPPVISTLRPLALAPVADKLLTATVADWINTSYVPGGTA